MITLHFRLTLCGQGKEWIREGEDQMQEVSLGGRRKTPGLHLEWEWAQGEVGGFEKYSGDRRDHIKWRGVGDEREEIKDEFQVSSLGHLVEDGVYLKKKKKNRTSQEKKLVWSGRPWVLLWIRRFGATSETCKQRKLLWEIKVCDFSMSEFEQLPVKIRPMR